LSLHLGKTEQSVCYLDHLERSNKSQTFKWNAMIM
jgi:hypothetical protein